MKKCSECGVEMIEETNLHTDYVGGHQYNERIFLDYEDAENGAKIPFSDKRISKRRVLARVCPKCGKVELYVGLDDSK